MLSVVLLTVVMVIGSGSRSDDGFDDDDWVVKTTVGFMPILLVPTDAR